jgi:predicted Zn-dependent protease
MQQIAVPAALLEAVQHARSENDTLAVLLHYRALLHWQPFNEGLMRQATGYALNAPAYDEITGEIGLWATSRSDDVYFLNALSAVRLRQGYLSEAARLLEAAERRDPNSKVMLYNQARLFLLQGDTLRSRQYFERYKEAP